MTARQYINNLEKRIEKLADADLLFPCVQAAHDSQINRIFVMGENGDGEPIGDYSTTPTYISLSASPRAFRPKGKDGKTKFKSGKPHKSGYFEGGYKEFRNTIGRRTDAVDLTLFGRLSNDFSTGIMLEDDVWLTGVKNPENGDKVRGLAERFGEQTWTLTDNERQTFIECCKRRGINRLKK